MSVILRGLTWDHPRAYEGLERQTVRFHETQKDIRVKWHRQSLCGFEATAIQENAAQYDLVILDHPFMGDAVASNCLSDLRQFDSLSDYIQDSKFVGRSLDSYRYAGGLWAMPLDAACQTAVFRPDLLDSESLPATLSEILEEDSNSRLGLAMACPHAFMNFLTLCGLMGADISGNGDRLIPSDISEEAVFLLRRLADRLPKEAFDWSSIGLLEAMATSDRIAYAPMVFCFNSYSRPTIGQRHKLRFTSLPSAKNNPDHSGAVIGGAGLAISAMSANQFEAAELVAFLVDDKVQTNMAVDGGQPAADSAWRNKAANKANGGFFYDCFTTMQQAIVRPRYRGYLALQNEAGQLLRLDAMQPSRPAADIAEQIEILFRRTKDHANW